MFAKLYQEVPAAQFDWNSSGLVNPLDASKYTFFQRELLQCIEKNNLYVKMRRI